jgi:hypothetical protein
MPGFDRTGPMGMGPRTGGGFGLCRPGRTRTAIPEDLRSEGYAPRGAGRGFAPWGGGRGRVWGGGRGGYGGRGGWGGYGARQWGLAPVYASPTPGDEVVHLRALLSELERDMEAVRERIKDLEAQHEK